MAHTRPGGRAKKARQEKAAWRGDFCPVCKKTATLDSYQEDTINGATMYGGVDY